MSTPQPEPHAMIRRSVYVNDLKTVYYEGGKGKSILLLHSGEYGADSCLTWEYNFARLADEYHVIAPDLLGFGGSAKVVDFGGNTRRRLRHLRDFCKILNIKPFAIIGSSYSAAFLLRDAATDRYLGGEALVAIAGGGGSPMNGARKRLLSYDGTVEGMRDVVRVLFADPRWASDREYVRRRWESAEQPGAWECAVAVRRLHKGPGDPEFGVRDLTPYETISLPTLLIAGAEDGLKEPDYAVELAARIPHGRALVLDGAGHMPQIEEPSRTTKEIIEFLAEV